MSFITHEMPRRNRPWFARKAGQLALAASVAASALFADAVLLAQATSAGIDLSTSGTASDEGQFVRIGLNKSVVIRLPADAKDVIIGNPSIVDAVVRTRNTAYLFARAVGQTNIFFFNEQGQQIMNIDLEVALDMKGLQKLIDRTIPGSQITVDTVNENVILGGTAASAAEAKIAEDLAMKFAKSTCACEIVNTINITGGDQVMLKVKVVEIKRSVVKNLGIDVSAAFDIGKFAFNMASLNPAAAANGFIQGGFSDGSTDIGAVIDALESEGIVRTLAEPNLTAVSGQNARFHAGGELPMINCQIANNNNLCTVEYKPYGVSLDFTPIVLSEGRISLNISTAVSEIGQVSVGINPGIDTRNMRTTIELPSGGSMMLAGLIKSVDRHQVEGTPGLKNLPVLGSLFRSRSFQNDQSELAIIVTPYIVNATAEKNLVTPDKRLNISTDRQSVLWGRLNKVYGPVGDKEVFHGNVGYIIE
jgi:pilus assembly protein CpaC